MSAGIVDVCYIALELSQRSWLVGYLLPGSEKVQTLTVAGGDTNGLLDVIARIGSKIELTGGAEAYRSRLRVCFEAGYDGFWLARFLLDRGSTQRSWRALEDERNEICRREGAISNGPKIATLKKLAGIGEMGATQLVVEVFHRDFKTGSTWHLISACRRAPIPAGRCRAIRGYPSSQPKDKG